MKSFVTRFKKLIVGGIFALIAICTIVTSLCVNYFSTKNLQTNLGAAQTTNYPISADDIIKSGLKIASRKYGYDCSGFIAACFMDNGASSMGTSAAAWWTGSITYEYGNKTYKPILICKHDTPTTGSWDSKLDWKSILPGDIIVGSKDGKTGNHVVLYLGKFKGRQAAIDYAFHNPNHSRSVQMPT